MKSIRIISRTSAVALVLLQALYLIHVYTPWYKNTRLVIQIGGDNIPILGSLLSMLLFFVMALFFFTIIMKSDRKSKTKKYSVIALVGVSLMFVRMIIWWSWLFSIDVRNFYIENSEIHGWITAGTGWSSRILLSVAVLCFIAMFPRKSLSFWGGLIFSVFSLLWVILDLNSNSFHLSLNGVIFSSVFTISIVGMALFFYGLTSNTKQING